MTGLRALVRWLRECVALFGRTPRVDREWAAATDAWWTDRAERGCLPERDLLDEGPPRRDPATVPALFASRDEIDRRIDVIEDQFRGRGWRL